MRTPNNQEVIPHPLPSERSKKSRAIGQADGIDKQGNAENVDDFRKLQFRVE